nr:putative late blight resistance protein homolog R1B-16 isoform X1 [Ipomoea batatas]
MAYFAITSLMETLHLNFLQSEPPFSLEDLEAQTKDDNENVGLLPEYVRSEIDSDDEAMKDLEDLEAQIGYVSLKAKKRIEMELGEGWTESSRLHETFNQLVKQTDYPKKKLFEIKSSSKSARDSVQSCFPHDGRQTLLIPCLAEVKQKIVSLHENLGLMQEILEKSEIVNDDAGAMKDVEAQIRDVLFKAEERIEMELSVINLAKGQRDDVRITASMRRLQGIFNEAFGQLEKLSIKDPHLLHVMPSSIPWTTSFLPNLKKLKFMETNLPWNDLWLIGMLPNLEVLKLTHACRGEEWEPSKKGFCQLKRLVIENTRLRYWNAVGEHFPMLECLELCKCDYLQEIPSGFSDINTLALIQLNECWDSLLASAKWIQEEQHSYENDTFLVRSKDIWVSFYPSNHFRLISCYLNSWLLLQWIYNHHQFSLIFLFHCYIFPYLS